MKEVKSLMAEPIGLAEQFNRFLGPNIYSWGEWISILSMLSNGEERGMIRQHAMQQWERRQPSGLEAILEVKYPITDPEWDNNENDRGCMKDL